ncbi:MAG: arginine--tRNA ligase [Bacillota bacterium]
MDFTAQITDFVKKALDISETEAQELLETPPEREMGDLALVCFKLAKRMRKAPQAIVAELQETLDWPEFVSRVEGKGAYLNIFFDKAMRAKNVLEAVLRAGENYGASHTGQGKTVCIDFSSINIAKPFHIGHLSSTAIGNALYRIYGFLGYTCVGINHLGDWGTQFGKLIVAYKLWGNREEIEEHSVESMLKLYVRFHDEAENDPSLEDQAREWFRRIEDGDPEALEIFNWFKELTLKEAGRVYRLLNVHFDSYAGESFYNDKMDRVISELRKKDLLTYSDGAWVVDLSEYGMPPCLLLKSDGATLYATRDIAAALYRKDTYGFDKVLYVVAYQQNLHFAQWFKVVELMGYAWSRDLEHVAFGMVSMEEGTLSTRRGKVVFLEDVLNKAIEKALEIINEKSPGLEDKEAVARQVGVGAVVWGTVSNARIKDIVFSYDRALNFEGETAPYVQYTCARAGSVLEKAPAVSGEIDYSLLCDDEASEAVRMLEAFPGRIQEAAMRNEPYIIARHIVDLAQAFNRFYYEHRIIGEDTARMQARLALVQAVRCCLRRGLWLLGIEAPEHM